MKLAKRILAVFIVTVFWCSYLLAQASVSIKEYDIYSHFLKNEYKGLIVVKDTTLKFEYDLAESSQIDLLRKEFPNYIDEISKDFDKKNKNEYPLEKKFSFTNQYKFISDEEIKNVFAIDNTDDLETKWNKFYNLYPNSDGFIELSRIIFSKNKKLAVFFISKSCGSLCGMGEFILLKKSGNKWKIKKKILQYIS